MPNTPLTTLPITPEDMPYTTEVELDGETYTFTFHYNDESDFSTVDLAIGDEVLCTGEVLRYGKLLFEAIRDERFPAPLLYLGDISGQADTITYDNLDKDVLLYVLPRE